MTRSTVRRGGRTGVRLVAAASLVVLTTTGFTSDTSSRLAVTGSAVTRTADVSRVFVDANGAKQTVSTNHVSVTVDETRNLRSLQLIHVSWTGAHPTGGLVPDVNSDLAQNQEYPMALFECRGIDSPTAPAAQRLSPQTCWTQFADERFSYGPASYPAWRSDLLAPSSERRSSVDAPRGSGLPQSCRNILDGAANQRWVPFIAADGTDFPGGPFGCAGAAPEASPANYSSLTLPSNETFGVSDAHGNGSANFDVFTAEDHASLGCSQTVACALVAIPVVGMSCDPAGTSDPQDPHPTGNDLSTATAKCEGTGNYTPGQILPSQGSGDPAVDGALWWSASNWSHRIVVPLQFAPPDNACALGSGQKPIDVYGSELMIQATTQWAPTFCNHKLFNFSHVQTPEPQARSLLETGNISAAFTSNAPDLPYSTPTVSAPTAITGFGVAFTVDNPAGRPVARLRLDARLLAKLLTESYPDQPFVKSAYNALANNPLNITQDPEFQALNPNVPQIVSDAAATMLTVNTDSDVMYALTSYIDADPDARAWLDGVPDPWGMVVNANYRGIALPVNNWPLLDTFEPTDEYQIGRNDCLAIDPLPWLPLVAAPTARLANVGVDMQFALAQSQTTCVLPSPIPGDTKGAKLVAAGRQASGHHFMLGVVSLGDAAREGLQIAQLETQASPTAPVRFTDATGRTFAGASSAGMRATAAMLTRDPHTGVWPIPYDAMRNDRQGLHAYPGTMVVYTDVPLQGLKAGDAKDYAALLRYFAGPGQHPGATQGSLPAGYLPMTAADHAGALATFTERAARGVAAQQGTLDPGPAPSPSPSPTRTSGSGSAHSPSSTSGGSRGTTPTPPAVAPPPPPVNPTAPGAGTSTPARPTASAPSGTSASGAVPPTISASPVAALTPGTDSALGSALLPVLLVLALAAAGSVVGLRITAARRSR